MSFLKQFSTISKYFVICLSKMHPEWIQIKKSCFKVSILLLSVICVYNFFRISNKVQNICLLKSFSQFIFSTSLTLIFNVIYFFNLCIKKKITHLVFFLLLSFLFTFCRRTLEISFSQAIQIIKYAYTHSYIHFYRWRIKRKK